jgi:FMN phosphatase YigB (HAD superfamily)
MMLMFDVGETLASEERWLGSWVDWLGVPRGTFAALGAIIEARRPYDEVFRLLKPDIDRAYERLARRAAGISDAFVMADLDPDALPTLNWARGAGYRVGLAGNTSADTEAFLRTLPFQADFIGSAASWKVSKPDAGFFHRMVAEAGCEPAHITYISDSVSNDVLPAILA